MRLEIGRVRMKSRYRYASAGIVVLALAAAGCSSSGGSSSASDSKWKTATSAAGGGGMAALVAAAKKEGTLNVIALPADWANYGNIIKAFTKLYGIKVDSIQPDDSSAQEVTYIQQKPGPSLSGGVVDVGVRVATTDASLFAPYQVATWSASPPGQKKPAKQGGEDDRGPRAGGDHPTKGGTS